jgi:hypothetical protein
MHHFIADPDPGPALYFNLLLVKVMGIFEHCSVDPPKLYFEPPGLHFTRPRPSTALEPLKLLKCMRFRIQLLKIMRIRIRNLVYTRQHQVHLIIPEPTVS